MSTPLPPIRRKPTLPAPTRRPARHPTFRRRAIGPRRRAQAARRASVPASRATHADDDEDEWRHPPVAPVDESNPLKSLGKAVSDTVTGSEDKPAAPKR